MGGKSTAASMSRTSSPASWPRREPTCWRSPRAPVRPSAARPDTARSTTCSPTIRSARGRASGRRSASPRAVRSAAAPSRRCSPRPRSSSSTTRSSSTTTSRTAREFRRGQVHAASRRTACPSRSTSATRRTSLAMDLLLAQHGDGSACARRCSSSARSSGWRASRPRARRSSSAGSPTQRFDLDDRDYVRMAYKKTCWYTVIAPLRIGVICGGPPGAAGAARGGAAAADRARASSPASRSRSTTTCSTSRPTRALYGKETSGDLWEGKRTVMLLHFLRTAQGATRSRALRCFDAAPRQGSGDVALAARGDDRGGLARARAGARARLLASARSPSTTDAASVLAANDDTAASCARCCAT